MNHRDALRKARLLLVTDPRPDLAERVEAAVRGGVDIVQLRDKHAPSEELLPLAEELRDICEVGSALFTVNDDAELAKVSGAAGLHIGQGDGEIPAARKGVLPGSFIGRSAGTMDEVREAVSEGADYLGVGAVYATSTKPEGDVAGLGFIRALADENLPVPWFAIGGVTLETAPEVAEAGAWGFAVVRAVLDADDPESAAGKLRSLL
ncbi:MAG: thiamine phosphate synthase [Rubrobacteraceae bacterium]|jgi:thiamine-phosphate pyrophosphorylase